MAGNRTNFRKLLTRGLAVMALLCVYGLGVVGASALLLGASSTAALARGGHGGGGFHGGGFHGGGFRGGGFGLGLGLGLLPYGYGYPYGYGGYYPYYGDEFAASRSASDDGCAARRLTVMDRIGDVRSRDHAASVSSAEAVSLRQAEQRDGPGSVAIRYRPQFQTLPIGVWVQHGPKPPPFQRP